MNIIANSDTLTASELENGDILAPRFDASGLVTAIVQEQATGQILMLAHMNKEALEKTLTTKIAHFWSRSRQALWKKGETSGNTLHINEIRIDCDQDAILLIVEMDGKGACHTGAKSCFYRSVGDQENGFALYQSSDSSD